MHQHPEAIPIACYNIPAELLEVPVIRCLGAASKVAVQPQGHGAHRRGMWRGLGESQLFPGARRAESGLKSIIAAWFLQGFPLNFSDFPFFPFPLVSLRPVEGTHGYPSSHKKLHPAPKT